MKNNTQTGFFRISRPILVALASSALAITVLFAACYSPQATRDGGIALEAVSTARSLTTAEGSNQIWIAGMIIDEAFSDKLKELQFEEDRRKDTDGPMSAVKDLWIDLALKSTVRFEGGRPFFQFPLARFPASAAPATVSGAFTILGIPANKSYYVYLLALDSPLETIDDFTGDPLATSPAHWFDPAHTPASGYSFNSSTGDAVYGSEGTDLPAGWYYFTEWNSDFDEVTGEWLSLSGTVWADVNGNPITAQSFSVEPGEATTVTTLLADW